MSAVYFKPNVHSAINGFDIDREKEKSKHFHINWAYWYEECWDNECKQIKIHIQHEGPYWFATKFNLHIVLECDPKEDSDYDSEEDLITEKFRIDNLEEPQVFTINLLDSSVSVDSIYAEISILDTGCITSSLFLDHDFSNPDRPHDVVLNFNDKKLYFNKVLLALWFNYFDRIFFSENADKNLKEVDLPEFNACAVIYLLSTYFFGFKQFPEKTDSAEDLMIAVELADKHNLSHVQASVSQFFGNFNAERKKKFVTKYEYRLKQLKLKNLLNFIEMGLKLGNNELDFTFAFAVDEQPEAAGIYQKSVDSFKNVTLLIGDQQFDVHKEYLSFWSPYFDRLFFGDFAEKGKNKIELKEIDPEEFSILMKIIYSPRNIRIEDSNVAFLLKLSDRFEMKGIMSKCGYYITTSVKNSSFTIELIELLEIADTYNLIDVQWACLKRIKRMNPKESEKFRSENRLRLIKLSHLMLNNIVQAI